MLELIGNLHAAINASKCQDQMFELCLAQSLHIPDELIEEAVDHGNYLRPYLESCLEAVKKYRGKERVDGVRSKLESL